MSVGVTSIKPPAANRAPPFLSKAIVTAYRWLGFLVLTCILVGLVGYIGQHLFYFVHRGWLSPVIVSPTDPQVLDLSARVAHESWMRQQVEASRADLEARIERDKKLETLELSYQEGFRRALVNDAQTQRSVLGQLAGIDEQYRAARGKIEESSKEYADFAGDRAAEQFSAKLIDQDALAARAQKLTEILQSNLAFRDRHTEISTRMSGASRESAVLGRLAKSPSLGTAGLSLGGLNIAKQFEESVLASNNAAADRVAAERALGALSASIGHYDTLLKTLEGATLLRAANRRLNLAFVPYANGGRAQPGNAIYGCRLELVFCSRVGRVKSLLEGEVVSKHPVYGSELRGQYVELEIDESDAMRRAVLHVGHAPLFF